MIQPPEGLTSQNPVNKALHVAREYLLVSLAIVTPVTAEPTPDKSAPAIVMLLNVLPRNGVNLARRQSANGQATDQGAAWLRQYREPVNKLF